MVENLLDRLPTTARRAGLVERMPDLRIAHGHEPHLRIDWFHRHVDGLVVEAR